MPQLMAGNAIVLTAWETASVEALPVATLQQRGFVAVAAAPDWTDGVDNVAGFQTIAAGDFRLAGGATAQGPALRQQIGAGGAMNGAVHTAATQQRRVGGIHDGIDIERGDVRRADGYPVRDQIHFRHRNKPSGISVVRIINAQPN